MGEEWAGTDLDEVIGGEDAPFARLNEDVDAVVMDKVINGVGGEGTSPLPNASGVLPADAYCQSLWGDGGIWATESGCMGGAPEDSHGL